MVKVETKYNNDFDLCPTQLRTNTQAIMGREEVAEYINALDKTDLKSIKITECDKDDMNEVEE